jgi:hypothetical protein
MRRKKGVASGMISLRTIMLLLPLNTRRVTPSLAFAIANVSQFSFNAIVDSPQLLKFFVHPHFVVVNAGPFLAQNFGNSAGQLVFIPFLVQPFY